MDNEQYAHQLIFLKHLSNGNPDTNILLLGVLTDFQEGKITFEEYLNKIKKYV